MNYWIFKVSDQGGYADAPGRHYVYDNTHSVRVKGGDEFLYLEKAGPRYALTGAGRVSRVTRRRAKLEEQHNARVEFVFTAHLADVVWFSKPFELSTQIKAGRRNRQAVGLPDDLNSLGWSISMPRIDCDLFMHLLDAALEAWPPQEAGLDEAGCRIDDSWSLVRKRRRMRAFRVAVLVRHDYTCVVCGTQLRSVLDAAHLRGYAADPEHRANPANGICLCSFCHTAFDGGDVSILPDGSLQFPSNLCDEIALAHFTAVSAETRRHRLQGVDERFLLERAAK